jgi:hypothetical protein
MNYCAQIQEMFQDLDELLMQGEKRIPPAIKPAVHLIRESLFRVKNRKLSFEAAEAIFKVGGVVEQAAQASGLQVQYQAIADRFEAIRAPFWRYSWDCALGIQRTR